MITDKHLALYGRVKLERAFCWECERHALIIDGKIQCCGQVVKGDKIKAERRMTPPVKGRKQMGVRFKKKQLELQDYRCLYCRQAFGSIVYRATKKNYVRLQVNWDHRIPFAYGQDNGEENVVAACHVCNGWKADLIFMSLEQVRTYVQEKWKKERTSD